MSHDIIEFNSVGLCKNQHKNYNVLSCQQPESESLVFNINPVMHSTICSNQDQDYDIIPETNNKTKTPQNSRHNQSQDLVFQDQDMAL